MQNSCWNQIGVRGNRTCEQLKTVIHCHNCSVYTQAGRELLDRPPVEEYIEDWTARLTLPRDRKQADDRVETVSLATFRLGQEWLALPADIVDRALNPLPIHSLPHRSDNILRGIVSVRGQLLLCVSLHELLGIATDAPPTANPDNTTSNSYPRSIAIQKQQDTWIFEADELYGLYRCSHDRLRDVPTASRKTLDSFIQAIVPWQDRYVSYLNADVLFTTLHQKILS